MEYDQYKGYRSCKRNVVPARIIGDDLLALVADVFHHHRNEIRIGELNLKGRGALSGVQCTAGIRQRAAGQMPARENLVAL